MSTDKLGDDKTSGRQTFATPSDLVRRLVSYGENADPVITEARVGYWVTIEQRMISPFHHNRWRPTRRSAEWTGKRMQARKLQRDGRSGIRMVVPNKAV